MELKSDLMFDEIPISPDKSSYTPGDWRAYAVHDAKNIKGFFGDYKWLSNFGPGIVWYEGDIYPFRENAYQAAKVEIEHRKAFRDITPRESKKIWKIFSRLDYTAQGWDDRKLEVMTRIVFECFAVNRSIRQALIDTEDKYLEETNHWGDVFWGVDIHKGGQNQLGKLLTKIRTFHQTHSFL